MLTEEINVNTCSAFILIKFTCSQTPLLEIGEGRVRV